MATVRDLNTSILLLPLSEQINLIKATRLNRRTSKYVPPKTRARVSARKKQVAKLTEAQRAEFKKQLMESLK